jgi:hypothetical protein
MLIPTHVVLEINEVNMLSVSRGEVIACVGDCLVVEHACPKTKLTVSLRARNGQRVPLAEEIASPNDMA